MNHVTLVNRTSKTLVGIWDGRRHDIVPGKNSFPEIMAEKFKAQHPVMGSENPFTLDKDYLLGIEEAGDPTTPVEQSGAIERFNRDLLGGPPVEVVRGNGLYAPTGIDAAAKPITVGGAAESGFVKP